MTSDSTAQEILNKCLSGGDRSAWEAFVRKYSKLIWNAIHKAFRTYSFRYSPEDLEDMYSSVFLALIDNDFKKLRQFKNENACSLSTWLSIITVRMTIDHMRKDKSRFIVEPAKEGTEIFELIPDNAYNADALLENKEKIDILRKSVNILPPKDRMIYDLLFIKGLSNEETARSIGISVNTLYSRKHRIAEKIKQHLQET